MLTLKFILLKLLQLLLRPYVRLDGRDNSFILSASLMQLLRLLGVFKRNSIYIFRVTSSRRFAFCIYPADRDSSQTITREISYHTRLHTFGFETSFIQQMFYEWRLDSRTCLRRVPVSLHHTRELIYFTIDR